jgi:hypothetical protein
MTAAELSELESHGPWTTDDLDELPESQRHHDADQPDAVADPGRRGHRGRGSGVASQRKFAPHEVLLAVDPVLVVKTHRLDQATQQYEPTGEFANKVTTGEPWPIDFSVSRLVPRHYRPA